MCVPRRQRAPQRRCGRRRGALTRAACAALPPCSEVNDKLSGELRVQLCRAKNSGVSKGTKPIANAGAARSRAAYLRG